MQFLPSIIQRLPASKAQEQCAVLRLLTQRQPIPGLAHTDLEALCNLQTFKCPPHRKLLAVIVHIAYNQALHGWQVAEVTELSLCLGTGNFSCGEEMKV